MKNFFYLLLLVLIASCGGKKSNPNTSNALSSKYVVDTFDDVDNVSSYDPEALKDLPRKVDLKNIMTSVKDQDDRGTCSFFTTTALFEAAIKNRMKVDVNLSEQYLNYSAKSSGYSATGEGGWPVRNQLVAIKNGMLLERDLPYQPSWFEWKSPCEDFKSDNEKAPSICFSQNKPSDAILAKKISTEKFESWAIEADNFKEIIETLANDKLPLSVVIPTHPNGMVDSGKIMYTEEMREECLSGAADCGSHAVVLTGYDLDKEVFYFKNSWSKKWGNEGYGEMPFSVVDRHVRFYFGQVKLTADIALPKDHAVNYLKFNKFEIDSKESADRSIKVKTQASLSKVGTNALIIMTTLQKRKQANNNDAISSTNTELVILNKEEQKKYSRKFINMSWYSLQDTEVDNLKWAYSEEENKVSLSSHAMSIPTVKKLRDISKQQMALSTVLYLYTDEGLKPLSTITHPLDYISYDFSK